MKRRILIVGAGFGGLSAALELSKDKGNEIYLIDRRNFHLFQPLLYQVAMSGLSPADISVPLRAIFRRRQNVRVLLAEVGEVDCAGLRVGFDGQWLQGDYLIFACGAKHAYFGNNAWEEFAPGLKNIEQALEIRRRVLMAFEHAEKEADRERQLKFLTFVVVGGGPTGVELAGAIREMTSRTLVGDFRTADLSQTKVILAEAGPRILPAFSEKLSAKAKSDLESLGVDVRLNARASDLSHEGLKIGEEFIAARTILWAAGVRPSSITEKINSAKDGLGRAIVGPDLSLPNFKNVFVLGDQAHAEDERGQALPGIAPVAIQQGKFLARVLAADSKGAERPSFCYMDKGIMATIGRSRAVVSSMGFEFSGILAWLAWVLIHVVSLMRFQNKFFVFTRWIWGYFTFGRGARLITYKTWRFYSGQKLDLD